MKIRTDMATGDDAHKVKKNDSIKIEEINDEYDKEIQNTAKETLEITKVGASEDQVTIDVTKNVSAEGSKTRSVLSTDTEITNNVSAEGSKRRSEPSTDTDQLEDKSNTMLFKSEVSNNDIFPEKIENRKSSVHQIISSRTTPFASHVVSSIQLGIEHAVTSPVSKSDRDLLMQDFMTFESTSFESTTDLSESAVPVRSRPLRFVFKTYAPIAFRYFRELFRIKPTDFLESFGESFPLKELSNSGNSGSIFYVTEDDKFILKTMQSKECSFLQKLLPGYYMNLHQNPNTLLPKYFGLYCYQCQVKKIKLVVMNNILPSSIKFDQRYDLKGATYKCRITKPNTEHTSPPTFKDLDFLLHHPSGLFLENETYNILMKTIKRDCTVLESFKIMDYSLLLGISKFNNMSMSKIQKNRFLFRSISEDMSSEQGSLSAPEEASNTYCSTDEKWSLSVSEGVTDSTYVKVGDKQSNLSKSDSFLQGGFPAINGQGEPVLIFIGIIDILQSYKLKKKLEHAWKSVIHNGDTVSVHNPSFYSLRFQKFMSEKVFKKLPVKRKSFKPVAFKVQSPGFIKPLGQTIGSDTIGVKLPLAQQTNDS